jgi:hypothetical protein
MHPPNGPVIPAKLSDAHALLCKFLFDDTSVEGLDFIAGRQSDASDLFRFIANGAIPLFDCGVRAVMQPRQSDPPGPPSTCKFPVAAAVVDSVTEWRLHLIEKRSILTSVGAAMSAVEPVDDYKACLAHPLPPGEELKEFAGCAAQIYREPTLFPPILTLTLQRFEQYSVRDSEGNITFRSQKVAHPVDIPLTLDFASAGHHYSLAAVIFHSGSLNGGHYWCVSKVGPNDWCCLNDTKVSRVTDAAITARNSRCFAYLLFYIQS